MSHRNKKAEKILRFSFVLIHITGSIPAPFRLVGSFQKAVIPVISAVYHIDRIRLHIEEKEAKEMILKAAMEVPQIRYIGWDVAVTPTGPAIIEGNVYCAHDFWQLPGQTPNNIGIMPTLKDLVPSYKY